MKNPFNIKKDIQQIRKTGEGIERKAPLVASIIKSIFIIAKWLIFLGIIFLIILTIVSAVLSFIEEKTVIEEKVIEEKAEKERIQRQIEVTQCSEKCNYSLAQCTQRDWDEKCPDTIEEAECFKNCLEEKNIIPSFSDFIKLEQIKKR